MSNCDAVVFNGEGTLHHGNGGNLFEKCLLAKELGKKVFLINSLWEKNEKSRQFLELFDLISVRDSTVKENVINDGYTGEVVVTPDMIFLDPDDTLPKSSVPMLAFVDSVKRETSKRLFALAKKRECNFYSMSESEQKGVKPHRLAHLLDNPPAFPFSLLVSGRFHASCLAIKSGIPVLSIKSNTAKTEGMLSDANISLDHYFLHSARDLTEERLRAFIHGDHGRFLDAAHDYAREADKRIQSLFDILRRRIKS